MKTGKTHGYTVVEMLVVLSILGLALALGYPAWQGLIQRTRVESFGRALSGMMQQVRSRAVLDGLQVVVRADPATGQVMAFLDRNGPSLGSPSDGLYNPIDGAPPGTSDQQIASYTTPAGVDFVVPGSEKVVDGFTTVDGEQVAIFSPTGSVLDAGAIRFGDRWGNYLEVRVAPAATALVTLRKYRQASGQQKWFSRDENGGPWEWYWGSR